MDQIASDSDAAMRKMEDEENHAKEIPAPRASRKPLFCLYISGATPKSTQAIINLKPVLDGLFREGYDLRVIDIYQNPPPGDARVPAVPVLIREYPLPVLRIGGDFSSAENIRRMLYAGNSQENLGD